MRPRPAERSAICRLPVSYAPVRRGAWLYPLIVVAFIAAIAGALQIGASYVSPSLPHPLANVTATPGAGDMWRANLGQPVSRLLVQLVVVILAAQALGAVARRLGQPSVIGEMAAGIALGPSFLGAIAPVAHAWLFPPSALGTGLSGEPHGVLYLLSQVGVILFMFVVGLDFNVQHVRQRARAAVVVSNVSILFPFLLGVLAAIGLYAGHAPDGISFRAFALFMGIAMSITAFPLLARILSERRMLDTPIGSMALTCAAVDDVTAWTLLAFVVGVVSADGSLAVVVWMLGLTAVFVATMLTVVRPVLRPLFRADAGDAVFSKERLALVMALLFGSALATQAIGVHALFGAFIAGAALPAAPDVRAGLRDRLETFSSVLLLPLFFVFTGLRTEISLITNASAALTCLLVIGLATAGKLGGSAIAARMMGIDWNSSFILGALMNTRGLMELIALNVGYDLGVISREMFTILVVMALVTTCLTGPLVDVALARQRRT